MSNIPFLYVNLIAMCGYGIILVSFLVAKKTEEVKAFIALLISYMLWTGGSVLMRLQVAPGLDFWYYVSILSLFCIAVLVYIFVCSFTKTKGTFLRNIWIVGTLLILVFTAQGIFLSPPEPVSTERGIVFIYDMDWKIAIPYAFFACIVASIVKVVRAAVRRTGRRAPGMGTMILGCAIIALGNLLQIIPGNIFPWDTLSGIISIGFLIGALYRKRMFKLTLLVSRGAVVFASLFFCLIVAVNYVETANRWIISTFRVSNEMATSIVIVVAVCLVILCHYLLKKLTDALFTREEQQSKLIKSFTEAVSQTLDSQSIMSIMSDTIKQEIPVENIYICMRKDGEYKMEYVSSPLSSCDFFLREDTPCAQFALTGETCFTIRDFQSSPMYLSMWDKEKALFRQLDIACILALVDREDVVGLVLLSRKERNSQYTMGEMSFLATAGSISAIAMKNAVLYEQMAKEARTDAMTGVYNYRYFKEVTEREFGRTGRESLALIFVDIDDFKLYNQLYGASEGDEILKEVAGILRMDIGDNGFVFRYSGKVFAVLLADYDARMARNFAENVQIQINEINGKGIRSTYKKLTASCGICVAPYGASTYSELIDNTDLATFRAKKEGKNSIVIFKSNDSETRGLYRRVEKIIDYKRNSILGDSAQTIFALTAAIDAKDRYTAQHSKNVAKYAAVLAAASGMNNDQIRMIYAAGILHDIGKISIPEHILRKEDRLTDDEYEIMKKHVTGSIDMIRHLPSMDYVIPVAIAHHERWDGKGYPRGIEGDEIPVAARCLAIADSFDAMTTDRPYRKALSVDYAVEEIRRCAGTQFDPELAELFYKLIMDNEIEVTRDRED